MKEYKTPLYVIYQNNKWKLIKYKYDWDIDIRLENNLESCKGDSLDILRIYYSGSIFENLAPIEKISNLAMFHKNKVVMIKK